MTSTSLIRAQVEARLADRIPSAFARRSPVELRTVITGVSAIDAAIGGIPCVELPKSLVLPGTPSAEKACKRNYWCTPHESNSAP